MSTHHPQRRFSGKLAALAAGTALAISPTIATAAPAAAPAAFGTAPLAASSPAAAGPLSGFEDNAALAVHWVAENSLESLSLDAALGVLGAGYGEALREEVLEWAANEVDPEAFNVPNQGKLAQIIGAYGEDIATFYDDVDLEQNLRSELAGATSSIYSLPFVMYGLQYTDDGVPAAAVDALRDLQCLDQDNANYGSFSWSVCGPYDMDATSWAVQAFIGAGVDAGDPAVEAAVGFLRSNQADNGGFENNVFGNVVANTNTAGLAVQAMRAAGDEASADRGAEFIGSLQAGWHPAGEVPAGLIAYDAEGYESFLAGEVLGNEPMATVQAMLDFSGQTFADLTAEGAISQLPDGNLEGRAPYGPTSDTDALLVAHWLQEALIDADGLLPNYGNPDWGITLDALISLAALGTGSDAAQVALDRFADEGEQFIGYGPAQTAKAAYTLLVYDEDPRTFFPGHNLLVDLRTQIGADGALGAEPEPFGQSFALLALARTEAGAPESAALWLADQQCSEPGHADLGGYGVPWGDMEVCDVVDADTTSLAIQALAAAGEDTDSVSIAAGLDWLTSNLNEEGAIEAWGDTSANSTSWAAQAINLLGTQRAAGPAQFLAAQVITPADVVDSQALQRADAGLIPASSGDREDSFSDGTADIMDGARFATAQAGLGLGGHGLDELTALGGSAAAPAPNFDGAGGTGNESGGSNGSGGSGGTGSSSGTGGSSSAGDGSDVVPARPQQHQPSYAG